MSQLPDVTQSFRELYDTLLLPVRHTLLTTAIEMGVFDRLIEPADAQKASTDLNTDPEKTELFLNALSAMGLLDKCRGEFTTSILASAFLVQGSGTYIGDFLTLTSQHTYETLANLPAMLKSNKGEAAGGKPSEDVQKRYTLASAGYQLAGVGKNIAAYVSALPGFTTFTKMLDLGGGPGLITAYISEQNPSLRCVVFEQPAVAEIAYAQTQKYNLEGRISILEGDYIKDDIGSGYDLVLAAMTLNYHRDKLDEIMEKIHDALAPGGLFLSLSDGLSKERTAPARQVLQHFPFSLASVDMAMDEYEIASVMERVGFEPLHHGSLPCMAMDYTVDLGKKR